MRRKAVSRRLSSVAEVRASLYSHRQRIATLLDERRPAAGARFHYQDHFDHLDHELATVEARLVAVEDEHVRQQVRLAWLRRRRDELLTRLYEKQTSVRRTLAGLYGAGRDFELAAISGPTPQRPQLLCEQVDQTIGLLRRPEGERPACRLEGVEVDFETLALDLEAARAELVETRAELERTLKASDATRARTHDATAEFDVVFPSVIRTLEGLFRLAGERELAERIRTSPRAAARRQDDEEGAVVEEPTAEQPAVEGAAAEETRRTASTDARSWQRVGRRPCGAHPLSPTSDFTRSPQWRDLRVKDVVPVEEGHVGRPRAPRRSAR